MPPPNKKLPIEDWVEPIDEILMNQRAQNVQSLSDTKTNQGGNQINSQNALLSLSDIPKELTRK
ncbi:MAG: hypothetical protein ACRC42_02060 [Mycoplasma sp.]